MGRQNRSAADQRGEKMGATLVRTGSEIHDRDIQVRTFGGFSVSYKGREITFGQQSESQIVHLLQMLMHFRDKGVSRELARAELFGDRDIDDVSHSIRNIIYNLRKKLREIGFPESQYVVKRGSTYFWADDVPFFEDAEAFERSFYDAMAAQDESVRQKKLEETIHMYSGHFLAGNGASAWAAKEAERYRELFAQAVSELAEILRQTHQYRLMHDVGMYASEVDPFAEWEILTLEALSGLGKFDRTERFYKETVAEYIEEYGKSNNYVREFINRIGLKLVIGHESIEEIQQKLRDTSDRDRTGNFCSLPVFQDIYRITERIMERSGDRVFLMLCTILDSKGNPMLNGPRLDDLSERLKLAITNSVRYSDTITRYGKGQYLILLINTSYDDCSVVARRINKSFMRAGQRTSVSYTVSNIIFNAFSGRGRDAVTRQNYAQISPSQN